MLTISIIILMSSKKDLIDFLIEYLVINNSPNKNFFSKNIQKNITNTIYLNSRIYDIKLNKYANNKYLEKEFKKYKL